TAAGGATDWLIAAAAAPADGWLFPPEGHNPRAPVLRGVIRHRADQRGELSLAGEPGDPPSLGRTKAAAAGRGPARVWRGVPPVEGDNPLTARVMDAAGNTVETLTRTVHYSNTPARAELVPEQSLLVADGVAKPVIAVRFLDRDGRPVRAGVTGPFAINP